MLSIFLKTTFRNLWVNKTNSFLNIFGLAVGIACAALIFLWVEDEVSYDEVHEKKDRLYVVKEHQNYDAGVFTHTSTPGPMAAAMKEEIPGVANTCRTSEGQSTQLFRIGDKSVYASGKYAEASLFDMFTLPFVQGNAKTAFAQLYSVVITEKTARKFFGDVHDVVGKTVRVDNKQDYVVTGVVKDIPSNSSLQFEWLSPFKIHEQTRPWLENWGNNSITTYVELAPNVNINTINSKVYNYLQSKVQGSITHLFLFGMNDWRLYDQFENGKLTGGGRIEYVRLFSLIAWIILIIACINFMNLSTARSEKRAREVGVRKVLGADKKKLVLQFIGEALLMSLLATVAAVVIVLMVLPLFNVLVEKELLLQLSKPLHTFSLLAITLVCGLLAGSYPSLYLSSFNPVYVLKGIKLKTGSAAIIRKGLVVLQFSISIILIIGTVVIYQQIQYVKSRNLGYSKENMLVMEAKGDIVKNFSSIKNELVGSGAVQNAALSDHQFIYGGNNTSDITWQGKNPDDQILISQRFVSPEFVKTTGIKVVDGRDFDQSDVVATDKNIDGDLSSPMNVVITESLAKLLGKGSAIGKLLYMPGQKDGEYINMSITGVVKDFVYGDMYGKPDPVVFFCSPRFGEVMYVQTKSDIGMEETLAKIEGVMKKNNPNYPFEYRFVDDQFNQMFLSEMLISKLSGVFALLAILISCLGLFGLAAYMAERRTKEIGIRKVLGASVQGLASLLSKDFLVLVGLACIIAFPVSWWMMNNWLEDYAYRINIRLWIFPLAGALAILIALLTVSSQAIRVASANPVKSLRSE